MASERLMRASHRAIRDVTADLEQYGFNTAVAQLDTLRHAIEDEARAGAGDEAIAGATDTLLLLLAPFAPHLAAEAWERRHSGEDAGAAVAGPGGGPGTRRSHIHEQPWPVADDRFLVESR